MTKSTKIHILDGPFTDEWSIQPINGGITYVEPVSGFVWNYTWEYAEVESIQFLNENIFGGSMNYSSGWGFIGAEAFGAAGLALGAKRDKFFRIIYFVCTLKDGRKFTASAPAEVWDEWCKFMKEPFKSPRQISVPDPPENLKDIIPSINRYFQYLCSDPLTSDKFVIGCIAIPMGALFLVSAILHFFHLA